MNDQDRANLASNIVGHATNAVSAEMQKRVVEYWTNVDKDLGAAVAKGIKDAGGPDYDHAPTNGTGQDGMPVGSGASTGL
jgi:catalase